jgi:acyl-CoA thioester hydrolase
MERLRETSVELEVPFFDVDALGVVWHGHYLKYLDHARAALLRSCGLDVRDMAELRYRFFVIDTRCRHSYPLFYADRMRVTAWVRDHRRRIFIAYEVRNLTRERRSARAHTVLATTDPDHRLLLETPDEIQRRLLG